MDTELKKNSNKALAAVASAAVATSTVASGVEATKTETSTEESSAPTASSPESTASSSTDQASTDSSSAQQSSETSPASAQVTSSDAQTEQTSSEETTPTAEQVADASAANANSAEAAKTEKSAVESSTPIASPSESAASSTDQASTDSSSDQQSSETSPASNQVTPSDAQKEQAVSSETTSTNTPSATQALQLKSATGTSAGAYTVAPNAVGTVVILHGCDYKPEAEDNIVHALQDGLPKEGWNTLSLELPNLSTSSSYKDLDAIMPDAAARLESAIAMAKEKSQTPVVLFAHSCGAQIALAWMEVKGADSIDGYIGLGAGIMNASAENANHLRLPLEKIKSPQLDIYGTADNEAVLKTAPERLSYINRAANPASRQKKIEGADHNLTGKGKELTTIVAKWLNELAFKK